MIRSLYSAVSGMLAHQKRMDIIGNNIANVNTVGFKSSDASFTEAAVQIGRGASVSQPTGLAVGLGATMNTTLTTFTQGAFQRTDVPSQLAISGEGFFGVQNANGDNFITRAGDFLVDSSGYIRSSEGLYLMGLAGTTPPTTPTAGFPPDKMQIPATVGAPAEDVVSYTFGLDGTITAVGSGGTSAIVGYVTLSKYNNDNGRNAVGGNLYAYNPAAGTNQYFQAGIGGAGTVQSGALELSNVDLAKEFSDMIVTQRGFDANARTITTSDEMLQTITTLKR